MTDSKMGKWATLWGHASKPRQSRRRRRQTTRLTGEALEQRRLLAVDLLDLPLPMSPLSPLGSRGYESRLELNLASVGEVDQVTVDLTVGQPLSLQLLPTTAGIQATINLVNAAGDSVAAATAPLPGSLASLREIPILEDGTYRILVSTLGGSGDVVLSALTSVTLEYEETPGHNDTWENAEDLAGRGESIGGGATRYLVRGSTSGDPDWYRLPVMAGQSVEIVSDNLRGRRLELVDPQGGPIAFSDEGRISTYTASETGELRLSISGGAGPRLEYTLNISVDAALGSGLAGNFHGARAMVGSGIAYGMLSGDVASPIRVAVHADPYDGLEAAVLNQLNDDTFFDFEAVKVTSDQIDTLAEVSAFDVVVVGSPYERLTVAAATAIRDFYNAGGGVVATGWFGNAHYEVWESSQLGQLLNAFLPVTIGSSHRFPSANITITDSSHPVTAGVNSFASGGSTDFYAAVDADATVLGSVNSEPAISVVERGGRSVYLPATYFWSYPTLRTGDADRLLEQAVAWAAKGDSVDSYEFVGGPGELTVLVTPHSGGGLMPINDSQLLVELFDLDGPTPTVPVATTNSAAAGTAPPLLVFNNTTGGSRRYVTSIHTLTGSGDYELVVMNGSAPAPGELTVIETSLPDAEVLQYIDSTFTFVFDRPIFIGSVDASDLTIGGTPASFVSILDPRTVEFTFDHLDFTDGVYEVTLSGISGLDGSLLSEFHTDYTLDTTPPAITDVAFFVTDNGSVADVTVELTISEPLDESNISYYPFEMLALDSPAGGSPWYGASDVVYDASQDRIWVTFYDLPQSRYVFEVDVDFSYTLTDLAGNVIDAANSGEPFSVLQVPFDLDLAPEVSPVMALSPVGAGVSALRAESVAGHVGDADEFVLDLEAGALLSIQAAPSTGSGRLRLELFDPDDNVVAMADAPAGGEVRLPNQFTTAAGLYRVRITSLDVLGRYQVDVLLGAAFEAEVGGGTNDTIETAETPQASPRVLAGAATTTAVAGRIGTGTRLIEFEEIGFIGEFDDYPVALTPASAGGSIIGGGEFLLTTGYDLFAVNLDGSYEFLTSLEHYAQAMVVNGDHLLTANYSTQLLTVDPASGETTSAVNMSRSDGLSLYAVTSMARTSDGRILVIFEGSSLLGNALGQLDPTTGVITPTGSLGAYYSDIAIDHHDRVFLELPPQDAGQTGELHQVELGDILQTSPIHRYRLGESPDTGIAFTAAGTLFRATGPLDHGGGGVEASGGDALDDSGSDFSAPIVVAANSGGWQRLEFEDVQDLADTYEIALNAGQWLSLAVAAGAASGQRIAVELLSPSGSLIAASQAVGSTSVIEGFVAPTSGTYVARVTYSGPTTDYRLIISRDANLAIAGSRQSQPIPPSGVVYGRTGVGAGINGTVAIDQPATFSQNVFGSDYHWDIQPSGLINDGSSDAYDGGMFLSGFNGSVNGLQDASGQSFRVGPSLVSGLTTTRSIYVPVDDTFARFIDTFTNTTATAIHATISYSTNLGSDNGTIVAATQNGDTVVDTTDRWILTDDFSSTAGDPSVGHLFFGEGGLAPSSISRSNDNINWSYNLSVAPGEVISLMSFAVQDFSRVGGEATVRRLADLDSAAVANLPADVSDTIVNWRRGNYATFAFDALTPTDIHVVTTTPDDAPGLPLNHADPIVRLVHLDGSTSYNPVAMDDDGAEDGRNASLTYTVAAPGHYGLNIGGNVNGDYVAVLSATSPTDIGSSSTFNADFVDIGDQQLLLTFPNQIVVTFDNTIDLSSVTAADLRINGLSAQSFEVVDGKTLAFDVSGTNSGDGFYTLSLPAGAVRSLRGVPNPALTRQVRVDASSPVVTASTLASGASVTPGQLVYQVTFSETLDASGLGPEDFTLTPNGGMTFAATSLVYDPVDSIATVTFDGLLETSYQLRIASGPTGIKDLFGNLLDGGPSFPLPSGDGFAGDDFIVPFVVDTETSPLPVPAATLQPTGGRIYQSETTALIGAASDSDRFVIEMKAGQPFFAFAAATSSLAPRLQVFDPSGVELSSGNVSAGGTVLSSSLTAQIDGLYALVVSSAGGTGEYSVGIILGASPEIETVGGSGNDTLATAEDLQFASARPVSDYPATSAAVLGQGGSPDHYRFQVTAGRPISIAAELIAAPNSTVPGGLSLLDADGTLIAVGSKRALGSTLDILELVPSTTGTMYVRIEAAATSTYQLVVLDGAAFDVEPNDHINSAQAVQAASTILGGLALGTSHYEVDFADNVGGPSLDQFTATGLWHVTNRHDGDPAGHDEPYFAYFGLDSSGNFNAGTVAGTLTSPPISLRAGSTPTLSMKYRLESEAGTTYDRAEVQISTDDGLTFVTVANKSTYFSQASTWTSRDIDLSSYAGETVLIRFSFNSMDGVANTGFGWQIDDLAVTGTADLQDYYALPANVGDVLDIRALAYESLGSQPVGDLVPQLELVDPSGLVVAAAVSHLTYTVPAGGAGVYRARVAGEGRGDYRIELSGSTADADAPAALLVSVPANEQSLSSAPDRVQFTFDQGLRIDSLQASDLVFADSRIVTTGVEIIDGHTIAFEIDVPSDIEGQVEYAIAVNALSDLQGTAIPALNGYFTIDRVGPRVIDTTPSSQASAPFTSMKFIFDEPLDGDTVSAANVLTFTGPGGSNLLSAITNVLVDGAEVEVRFLPQTARGEYTLTIGGNIADVVGNWLDQDQNGVGGESADTFTRSISLQSPDLMPMVASLSGNTVFGQTVTLNYTVTNLGNDPALERWFDRVYLSRDGVLDRDDILLTTSPNSNSLGPLDAAGGANSAYTRWIDVSLPLSTTLASGTYFLLVQADAGSTQPESNEANNVASTMALTITLPPMPDLVIEQVVVPTTALSGQPIPVQWRLANRGTGDFAGSITDQIRLSTDTVIGSDAFLANFVFTGVIPAGGYVEREQFVTLPLATEGERYLVLTTDAGSQVFEHLGENNNTMLSSAIDVALAPLPNLRVTSVTPPTGAFSSQPTTVDYVVTNTGTGPTTAPIWYDAVYLSTDGVLDSSDIYLGKQANPGFLEPGGSYASSITVTLPRGLSGDYQLLLVTDHENRVFENLGENDNVTASSVFAVTLTPPPDLRVQSVTGPFSAFSGAPANVSFTIENAGDGRTLETSWYDEVYLSTDETLDASDVRVGRFLHSGPLNAGATYAVVNQPVELPIGIEGDYYFIVATDSSNHVYENVFEGNNVKASAAATNVRLTPPPDLVPTFDVVPTSLSAGRSFEVAFTVTNLGITPTVEHHWRDHLYLSSDPLLDANDTLLQSKTHHGNLGVFQSYLETFSPVMPWTVTPGNYFLILATDVDDRVFELENVNNVVATIAPVPLTITAPDLTTASLNAPTSILAGQPFSASWTVANLGIGSTTVARRDDLVLSTDAVLGNADDIVLKSVSVGGTLAAGTSQTVTAENIVVPLSSITGSYHLFVRADAANAQFESTETNNTFGPITTTVTQNLPDLIAEGVTFNPQSLTSQGQLIVDWTTRNLGAAVTNVGYWVDRIYLSSNDTWSSDDRLIGSLSQNAALASGETRARQAVLNLPAEVSGDFYVIVVSDATSQVVEGPGEANNAAASASLVNVTLHPTPDLRVTAVDAPVEAFSGQSVELSWTVTNSDAATANGNWYDAVYLSSDQVFDRNTDIYLGFRNRPASLAAPGLGSGQAYSQTENFEIPLGIAGPFYVFVATDSGNIVFERGGELNNANYDSILTTITLLPPADLVVGTITIPPDTEAGAHGNLSYTVRNQGVNPARGTWQDSLYLSSDGVFSLDDWLLGTVSRSGDLPGFGGEYSATLSARLPGVIPGDYQIIVRSDIRNAIIESNEENNLSASLDAFAIDLPRLELDFPATGQLAAGESLFWTIDLTAGDSVRFTLDNASGESTSEIYLRRAGIPSRSQFDYAANVPFTNDPSVVIPVEESGTYYVMAYGATAAANRNFSLLAEVVPLSIFDVRTRSIGDSGSATVKVSGARFDQQTQFSLVHPTDPTQVLPAADVLIQDSVTAFVTFNAIDFAHGSYTLVAQQQGTLAALEAAVTVTQAVSGDVFVTIDGAQRVLPDRLNPFRIQYTNDGNTDFSAPLFIVENPNQLPIGFTPADVTTHPLHVFAVPPDGDSSVLRPGPIGSIPVVFRSPADGEVNFPIRPVRANDPRIINETEWQQIEASIRPADLDLSQWNAFWAKIQPRIGTTWGAYVRFVQDLHVRTQELDVRKGDVRAMMQAVFEDDPQWRPNSMFSGRLLMSNHLEAPIADVSIAAYRVTGGTNELQGATVTAADGSFQFAALPPGEYVFGIDLDGHFFDADRDGVIDDVAPRAVVQTSDIENFTLYVAASPEPVVSEEQPSVVVDSAGLTHIVWLANQQLWHAVADASGEFTAAQAIVGASGSDPVIVAGDTLVDGGSGLMVVYRSGNADDAELFYVLGKRNAAGTAYLWSTPVAMTDDAVHDGGFDVGIASDGLPVVLSQRLSVGDEFSDSSDDADIYSWSQAPTGDFEAALLAAFEAALADDPDLQAEGGSVRFRLQNVGIGPLNIPNWVPYLGGKYEANFRASATVAANGCSASGKITAEGQVKFTDYVEGNLRGEGGVEFQSNGQKGNCEYEFDNAFLAVGGGAAGDIPFAKLPGLGKIDAAAGIRLEGQAGLNFRWPQGSDFPSWPQKIDGSLRVGIGGYAKGKSSFGWLGGADLLLRVVGSASWTIHSPSDWDFRGFSVTVLARAEIKVTNPITGNDYKKFKEFTFTWNSSGAGSDSLSLLGGSIDTAQVQALAADSPDNLTFGIELVDASGTVKDYSTDTFHIVTQDLLDDTPPTIATAPDGTLYGLWSNRNGVNVHRYNADTDVWSLVGRVGDDTGLATRDARMTFDNAGQGIIVFAGQNYSHLSETSTAEEIDASFAVGSDLYYATFDPATETFSDDLPLFSLVGDDSGVSLLSVAEGDIIAIWTHTESDLSASVYSARYSSSTGTWSPGTSIATAVAIGSRTAVSVIGGVPTVIWSQDNSSTVDGQFSTSSPSKLMTSKLVDGVWTPPADFMFTSLVNTTRLAATSNGEQAQIYTTPDGELNVITSSTNSDNWSQPTQLSLVGEVAIDTAAVAYDAAGQAIAIWIEVVRDDMGQPASSHLNYASQSPASGLWSQPQRLATSDGEAGQLQLTSLSDGGWMVAWTESVAAGEAAGEAVLRTASWTAATRTFDAASTRSTGVVPGSVSVGSVGDDTVLLWRRAGAETSLDRGLTYSIHSSAGWGEAIAAASLVHAEVQYRSKEVTREASRAEAFDQYKVGIATLLAKQFGGAMLMTGAGVYLRAAGILPFSPPEDCCECSEFDERTVGSNEGCGATTEIDRENCIRITTYKPCVERPIDPNDILGPQGFGEERWVSSLTPLSYRIRFENSAEAGAAARLVDVTQVLDDDLWLPTFSLKGFGFRGYHFEIPGSPPFYSTVIDLTDDLGVLVEFTAGINVSTREAFWRLVALDPATGQPPLNPDLGLLIPNDAEGNGEGYLDYSIGAIPTVTTGARVDALARIVFDTEEPIDTPPIFNTFDALAPTSSVIAGPAPEGAEFTVSWSGQDEANGSGLASYTILVSVDGGNYSVWLGQTTAPEAVYSGKPGSTYSFVSLAADNAENLEAFPEQADWTVTLPGGSATIGDFVWHDLNDNGLVDLNEPGLDGVSVSLFIDDGSAEGILVASAVTSDGGAYSFTEMATDVNYFLKIAPPDGFAIGKSLVGDDTTLDSDFALDGRTAVFTAANGNNLSFDAALVQTGSIGGLMWEDLDGDGVRDLAEPGLSGWIVYLDLNDNGALDAGEPSRLSGPDGQYVFADLRPGTYVVAEVLQPGYVQTFPGEAGASTTHRSYVRSGSQAELFLPALDLIEQEPLPEGDVGTATAFGSPASQLIGLESFLADPRFSGLGGVGTVVVIDTGIDLNHEFFGSDLDGDGVADRIIFQYDFADNDLDASDRTGHGSHVAGLIAGSNLRYPGVAPEANIIALKVFGDDGRGKFADVERALQWVIENAAAYNIDAVNLSIGDGMNWSSTIGGYGISDELAVLTDLGVITVAAAGNGYGLFNTPGLAYPAADPNTISVGALWDSNRGGPWRFGSNGTDYSTAAGRVASFSQRDPYMLDVLAPGAILTSANQYGGVSAMRGTSMSAPQVAGAAVWAQTIARNTLGRSLTTSEFRYLLRQSGTRLVDGDDENDSVFNTGSTYAGLNLVALGEAVLTYDGTYSGSGFTVTDTTEPGNAPGVANGRPNRYLINLAPGQERVVVDFGNRLADAEAPQVIGFSEVTPAVRNQPVNHLEVTFSEPIDPASLTVDDFTLRRGSTPITLASATLTQINETTWQLNGLSNLTSLDGSYTLTLAGTAVSDPAGNVGEGTAERSFMVDRTAPVGTVQPVASFQNSATFAVTVVGQDPFSGGVASGVASYEIYAQVNGGAFSLWTTVPATDPTAFYTAESNQVLGFYAIAIDAAGNRETGVPVREVATRTGDVTQPLTSVVSVNAGSPSLSVNFAGSDAGGSGLATVELMVSIDGGIPLPAGTLSTSGQAGTITGSFTYPAIQDGVEHSYRFFTVGVDGAGNREAAPDASSDVIVTAAFEAPVTTQVTSFRVQGGSVARSFIQTLEVVLSDSGVAAAIAASMNDTDPAIDRMSLVRLDNGGATPIDVSLASRVTLRNGALQLDFGAQGIGGNRSTSDGNGNYELRIDLDGDASNGQETLLTFYRLFGDTNGDRVVDNLDVQTVDALQGQGAGSVGNINGDAVVNVLDRTQVRRSLGDSVAENLMLSVLASSPPQVTGFDVQNGQTQRSFIRYLSAEFSAPEIIDQLVASLSNAESSDDRVRLEKFDLNGLGAPQLIDLTARASAVDQALLIDFGTGGLPGGGNSNAADGYYRLSIDLDGDLSNGYESQLHFHRLMGDVNGDGRVDSNDLTAVTNTADPEADVNGDGVVNVLDRTRVMQSQNRQLNNVLPLND